ncbi:hypothetical protein ERJ75_001339200 [Trypanosoma vivax]|uniref:Uncharacterized protein n=1 Tax=Trypanosoma vivax (strain Y486) TaxID=1055687 RepID=F9WNX8_TRYVY|nr:hypothetical protein TRVL_07433 [Trypanosoma vivax]KAH8608269.1 hypothetical protein ERJ75_001339200 [Trypanosoma vivax]CCD19250.1 hypothetical protein, conserved [Trypanosoma vivax Y486]|eukprot:CCD19250.1 hypothetical protein, conserved [Trypanosoma vivax Y486]
MSKSERICDAMKVRIAQLEEELSHCRECLKEATYRKEEVENSLDVLQHEAHDVVGQWAERTSELELKLEESAKRLLDIHEELRSSVNEKEHLKQQLEEREARCASNAQKLLHMEEVNSNMSESLAISKRNLTLASQQISTYESLINKVGEELMHRFEDIVDLIRDKKMLLEATAELRMSKQQAEKAFDDAMEKVRLLESELGNIIASGSRNSARVEFLEEEQRLRNDISFCWIRELSELIFDLLRSGSMAVLHLREKVEGYERSMHALSAERASLEEKLQEVQAELTTKLTENSKKESELRRQIRDLGQKSSELQNTVETQKRVLNALEEELNDCAIRRQTLECEKEDLETEFKAVRECYSTLLQEHSDLRATKHKLQQETNAKIACLTDQRDMLRGGYEKHLSDARAKIDYLTGRLHLSEVENLFFLEQRERLSIALQFDNELMYFLHCKVMELLPRLVGTLTELQRVKMDMEATKQLVTEKQVENHAIADKMKDREEMISIIQEEKKSLESRLCQLEGELALSNESCEKITNDNYWLTGQVESMRKELDEVDELFNSTLNSMREESEKHQFAQSKLQFEIQRCEDLLHRAQDSATSLEERCGVLVAENSAISKTLALTEEELAHAKEISVLAKQRECLAIEQKKSLEAKLVEIQREHVATDSQIAALKEQVRGHDARLQLVSDAAQKQLEIAKTKLNEFIEKHEDSELRAAHLAKSLQESKDALCNLQEAHHKAKATLEEAKRRCYNDAMRIQELVMERQHVASERDHIIEKYNRLHDLLKAHKNESSGRLAEEIQKLSDLCSQQEVELQQLRYQNVVIKRAIMRLPAVTSQHLDKQKCVERLNVSEGPLRRPRKRSAVEFEGNL